MSDPYPQRPQSHQLEEASRRFFVHWLPPNWASDRPAEDYGVDLHVDIFEGDAATGLELLVQLKASEQAVDGDEETLVLRSTTYNMLRDKLQVVMLVKYSRIENEGYWILLRDANAPQEGRESVTVAIPKRNRLSQLDWAYIQSHVRSVTDIKLAAARRLALEAAGRNR